MGTPLAGLINQAKLSGKTYDYARSKGSQKDTCDIKQSSHDYNLRFLFEGVIEIFFLCSVDTNALRASDPQ